MLDHCPEHPRYETGSRVWDSNPTHSGDIASDPQEIPSLLLFCSQVSPIGSGRNLTTLTAEETFRLI